MRAGTSGRWSGAYDEPLQLARVVHNLEHGGIYIFYGDEVSDAVVDQLQGFYDDHKNGTLLAPYPKLGNKVALGAWVSAGRTRRVTWRSARLRRGRLLRVLRGVPVQGAERYFPSGSMLPGDN